MDFVEIHPLPRRLHAPLRAALRGERGDWPERLESDEVRALAAHGVAPLAYDASHHPDLRGEALRAAALEPLRRAHLRVLLDALGEAGIRVLVVKGGALATLLYPAPELRPRGDTDLFISESSLTGARMTLEAAGLKEHPSSGDVHGMRQTMFSATDGAGIRHVYDLHWSLANAPIFSGVIGFEDAWSRSLPLEELGAHARTLDRADALLHACIHRVAHHHDSERLVWLVDIALLRRAMGPEEHQSFWRRAAEHRIVGICAHSVALAEEWSPAPPGARAGDWLAPDEIEREEPSRVFLDQDMRYGRLMVVNLAALPWRDRLQRIWQLAFPPAEFMLRGGGAGRIALPWRYAARGIRGVRRLFRRAASTEL